MKRCSVSGQTYGAAVCTDECAGYYSADGSIDQYVYRYYTLGIYNDGNSANNPGCPSPGEEYYPQSPMCYRGCCPSGMTCDSDVATCSGTFSNGYLDGFAPSVPTVNNMSLASGLPTYTEGAACADLTEAECVGAPFKDASFPSRNSVSCTGE